MHLAAFFIVLAFACFHACKKDSPVGNMPPDTHISVSQINLTGNNRLGSVVTMHWSGTDVDGFIAGYEVSFNNTNWVYTKRTDSTFKLNLPKGADTTDLYFYVRSIDNKGAKDPSPATIKIPIKNSRPVLSLDDTKKPKDTAFLLFSIPFNATDADGDETIDSIFIKINNGNWYPLSKTTRFVTIVPTQVNTAGAVSANVYKDINATKLPNLINGLQLNGNNTVYIKARDIAGSSSDTQKVSFYLQKKNNNMLVINASSNSPNPSSIYLPILNQVYPNYDYVDFIAKGNKYFPTTFNPTFDLYIKSYSRLFIFTDESKYNGVVLLEAASPALQDFLNNGGKLLVSTKFANGFDNSSPIFEFAPMDSLSSSPGQARIPVDSLAVPDAQNASSYSTLKSSEFVIGADPFYVKSNAQVMFRAQLQKIGGWKGSNVICAKTHNGSGKTNQVFCSVDLSVLNGDPAALKTFFTQVMNNEFNW